MAPNDNTVLIENARLMFRNFAGREQNFNSAGDRNFCIMLDDDLASQLEADGWNVKYLKARDEGDTPQPYLQVKVNYGKGRPPRVIMVTSRNRNDLGADEVGLLDIADMKKVDVLIRPYDWEVSGKTGRKAYLKTLFAFLNEDELELKYANLLQEDRDAEASAHDDLPLPSGFPEVE